MTESQKNHALLHFVVFLWGFTAILGKLITISALALVWHRLIIAVIALFVYLSYKKISFRLRAKDLTQFCALGFLIALHWLAFYSAIKLANVSIALVCLSSGTLFTALLEPLFFKRRIHAHELIFGVIIMMGIAFIFKIESAHKTGIAMGILAAITSALFLVLNGAIIKKHHAAVLSFYELLGGFFGLTLFIAASGRAGIDFILPQAADMFWLLILGIVCTAFTFVVSSHLLKKIHPFTVMIAIMMEPVYGIVLAYFIFGQSEHMQPGFYVGALVILVTIFANSAMKKRSRHQTIKAAF